MSHFYLFLVAQKVLVEMLHVVAVFSDDLGWGRGHVSAVLKSNFV